MLKKIPRFKQPQVEPIVEGTLARRRDHSLHLPRVSVVRPARSLFAERLVSRLPRHSQSLPRTLPDLHCVLKEPKQRAQIDRRLNAPLLRRMGQLSVLQANAVLKTTASAYASHLRLFEEWCRTHRIEFNYAHPESVESAMLGWFDFLYLEEGRGSDMGTKAVAALGHFFRGMPRGPTTGSLVACSVP